jgi:hypothetical protein
METVKLAGSSVEGIEDSFKKIADALEKIADAYTKQVNDSQKLNQLTVQMIKKQLEQLEELDKV